MVFIVNIIFFLASLNYISCYYDPQISLHRNNNNFGNESQYNGVPYAPPYQENRKSKFFPLFSIIRFSNDPCPTTNEEHGVCFTRNQCAVHRGTAAGSCAQGLGVCCQFYATCGSIVTQNGTLFRNPDFPNKFRPSTGSDVCQVRVRKQLNICQLRLNFITFDIDGPVPSTTVAAGGIATTNEVGTCKTDALTITSSGATVPNICGSNSGQHVYLDFGSSDTVTLNIMLSSNANRDREWNIEIQQIACRSEYRAPSGCLQFFQGVSGQVRSFNQPGGVHLSNMDYSVCVRMEDGMRSIEWSACAVGDVKISGVTPLPAQSAVTVTCTNNNDYLSIMGGVAHPLPTTPPNPLSNVDRFCDQHFGYANSVVRSTVRPFILRFRTDGTELAPAMDASTGFCLKWQQSPQG